MNRSGDAPLPVAIVAARLADALMKDDLIFIAADEQRAEAVAALLSAAMPDACILHAPSSDALPGDSSPPTPANAGRRAAALRRLRDREGEVPVPRTAFIVTAEATARLYPPPEAFDAAPPVLRVGDTLDLEAFKAQLLELGYIADDRVDEPGEIAVRGQVIDIFPADAGHPARLEFEANRISAIRRYDPVTQRGEEALDLLEVGRANEPAETPTTVLTDHLANAAIALDADVDRRRDRYIALAEDIARRPHTAGLSICDDARWQRSIAGRQNIDVVTASEEEVPRFVERKATIRSFERLVAPHLAQGGRFLLAGADRDLRFLGRRVGKVLGRDLKLIDDWTALRALPSGQAAMIILPIERGWRDRDLIVTAAADLLGGRAASTSSTAVIANPLTDLGELRRGDVVVHEDHGIGVIAGIEVLPTADDSSGGDAIRIEYAGDASRLVPATEADRIWRYGGEAGAVALDKLDGSSWAKRRGEIDKAIATSARALTALAAKRAERRIEPIKTDSAAYERFSAGFPFSETQDQARAIAAVRTDLASQIPMDRLVIGDVGYGKTEVALRAAALAVFGGRQVAIAAPTTVLVRQHLETFERRFADSGVKVASLSRLSTPSEKKVVWQGLADGEIDIVIGTGAIAAKGVAYRQLGLVVIDEEQRFGAADKEKLRALAEAHVLTLSATPIPRTLQMALVGLQDLSIIASPPARRQPIRTSLSAFEPALVRTALMREKSRGGQSFVVVPRIEDMPELSAELSRLVPELLIIEAHGKMSGADMDAAMIGFANGCGDILLATNIIEAGLDVPRANTMIVWHADRFGLSQLHQLRGRVGRGGRRGQVFLLTDPGKPLAEATLKRLRTLQAFDRLGAGFAISTRDLDLRGAGDLLGDEQAGHIKLIGIELYQHLLGAALRKAHGETNERWSPELDLSLDGQLPASWIPDQDIRIALYARLARIDDADALDEFEEELSDRFGALPNEARQLMLISRVRLLARSAGIRRIVAGPAAIAFEAGAALANALREIGLVEKGGRYLAMEAIADPVARVDRVHDILDQLVG